MICVLAQTGEQAKGPSVKAGQVPSPLPSGSDHLIGMQFEVPWEDSAVLFNIIIYAVCGLVLLVGHVGNMRLKGITHQHFLNSVIIYSPPPMLFKTNMIFFLPWNTIAS